MAHKYIVGTTVKGKGPLRTLEERELRGRMYECIDIQRAIEDGQLKSLEDVLSAITQRAEHIDKELKRPPVEPIICNN